MSVIDWGARQRAKFALRAADRHRQSGAFDQALADFERAGRLDGRLKQQALETAAVMLIEQQRLAEALPRLQAIVALDKTDTANWRRLARVLLQTDDRRGAIKAWRRLIDAEPRDIEANQALVEMLPAGAPESIEPLGVVAEAAWPGDPAPRRRLARLLEDNGRTDDALASWRLVLAASPDDAEANERSAHLLEASGRKAEAAIHLQAAAEATPSKVKLWRRLAAMLEETGSGPEAFRAWQKVLESEPNDIRVHASLARLLEAQGLKARALPHIRAIAEAGKDLEAWRRLARLSMELSKPDDAAVAWRQVLSMATDDREAHERLAQLMTEAGREAEAAEHFRSLIQIMPENAKVWRRYVRARRRADESLEDLAAWREVLGLAGHPELDNQLKRAEQAIRRNQDLKHELQAAGAELKHERGATGHALNRLEREERAHRATQGLLKDELAERRRLTAELQDSVQRQRQAAAEEASHLIAGRLIGLLEPLAGVETSVAAQADDAAAFAEECLRAVAADGALVVASGAGARLAGVDVIEPADLAGKLRGRAPRLVVLADRDPAPRAEIRAGLEGKRGLGVIDLSDLVIRRAAGMADLKVQVEPVSDDVWPPRPLMVMSADEGLLGKVVQAIGRATSLAFAPQFPAALAAKVQARELDLDDWLAAAWTAHGRPRAFGFQFDPETLALFAREIRAGRALVMAKVFRRATALHLTWSDKALFAAADHFARSGEEAGADFDAGDAQIEVKTYRRLIARDMQLESAFDQLGKFRPATVKAYRELFDKPALGRFCRDAGLSLGVAGFADVDERSLAFLPPAELIRAGGLIAEAVETLTAAREPEAPPQGLVQYSLGRSLEALGRHAEALEAYREAVVRAPTYFPARAAAARYLELAGRPAEAKALLRQGMGNGTPDPDVQEGLLDFYQRNASPLGVAAVSRLMMKRGQSRPAITAPALVELGRWRDADPLLKTIAPRVAGQDTFLNDLMALPELAARLDQLTAQAKGGDAAAGLRLAEALRRLGRLGEALPWYRRALAEPGVLEAAIGPSAAFRPQFLMVGPPRTGTTLLRRLFDLHPQIATPSGELFFFSSRTGQRAGSNRQRAPLDWYLGAFQAAAERKPDAKLIGEKTPHYFSTSDEQMAFASLLLPQVKIIATLRDPVVRAWSEIKVQRRATEAEIVAALSAGGRPNWLAEILDAGRYAAHLKRWLKYVTPDRLLLVDSDALESQVVEEAGRIFRWLGVKDLPRKQVTALQQGWNNRTESFAPSAQVEALLRGVYAGEPWTAAAVGRALEPLAHRN